MMSDLSPPFEYRVTSLTAAQEYELQLRIEDRLNDMGLMGWELVHVESKPCGRYSRAFDHTFFWKRRKE